MFYKPSNTNLTFKQTLSAHIFKDCFSEDLDEEFVEEFQGEILEAPVLADLLFSLHGSHFPQSFFKQFSHFWQGTRREEIVELIITAKF